MPNLLRNGTESCYDLTFEDRGQLMPYETVGDLRMYYQVYGSPTAPSLLMLHGFGGSSDQWEHQIGSFSETYRVVAPDLREHGRTNNPSGSAAMNHHQFAAEVATSATFWAFVVPPSVGRAVAQS